MFKEDWIESGYVGDDGVSLLPGIKNISKEIITYDDILGNAERNYFEDGNGLSSVLKGGTKRYDNDGNEVSEGGKTSGKLLQDLLDEINDNIDKEKKNPLPTQYKFLSKIKLFNLAKDGTIEIGRAHV